MARGRIYNKIYSDELWEKVNQKNKDLLDDFIMELKQRQKSKGTIYGYKTDIRVAFIYILQNLGNKYILELNKRDFRAMMLWMTEDCQCSPARSNRFKSAINMLMDFCERDDEYDYEINMAKKVQGVPNVKVRDNEDNFFFTFDEFIVVRERLLKQGKLFEAMVWSLGFDSAGRKNELVQIKKELHGNKTNIVVGKRGKKFPLVFLNDTKEIIEEYLKQRGEDDIPNLFVRLNTSERQPATADVIYRVIVNISKELSDIRGKECEIFPHSMRHSRVECLLQGTDNRLKNIDGTNRKYSLDEVKVLCHHEDVGTTSSYAKNHDEDIIDEMFGF